MSSKGITEWPDQDALDESSPPRDQSEWQYRRFVVHPSVYDRLYTLWLEASEEWFTRDDEDEI